VLFAFAISLATLVLMTSQFLKSRLGPFPSWFNALLVVFLVARLVALSGIWAFRRWGVYAFLLLECTEVAMGLFVFNSVLALPIRAAVAVPSFLALLVVWYVALRLKWPSFT
jgi:hypothetical protein